MRYSCSPVAAFVPRSPCELHMIWQVSEMHIPEIDDQGQQEYRSCLWTKPEQVGGDEDVGFSPGIIDKLQTAPGKDLPYIHPQAADSCTAKLQHHPGLVVPEVRLKSCIQEHGAPLVVQ